MTSSETHLLIVDPQEDFCNPHTGALYVPGAEHDMERLASLIDRLGRSLTRIDVTLDSHHAVHVFFGHFWQDPAGNPPPPFTTISYAQVEAGVWRTRWPEHSDVAAEYTRALEATQKYRLTIWPTHCLLGSRGALVYSPLFQALQSWERATGKSVVYRLKGEHPFTEHYSAVKAEVPVDDDPGTLADTAWTSSLTDCDTLLLAGEALSHCFMSTVSDLADLHPETASRFTILTDLTSSIPGFEPECERFLADMETRSARLLTSTDLR